MKKNILLISAFLLVFSAFAQLSKTQTVMLSASSVSGGLLLKWPQESFSGSYKIFKRVSLAVEDWGSLPLVTLASTANSFLDSTVLEGTGAEYRIDKLVGISTQAFGVIYAGNKLAEPTRFQSIILLIDSNYLVPLSAELQRLKSDLESEGWLPILSYAGRSQTPKQIRDKIKTICGGSKTPVKTLFIVGHVPVPYSGYFSGAGTAPPPDGHVEGSGNHTGAWPADVYYGELDEEWTDQWVNCSTGASSRNHNTPGDGKFDDTKIPGDVDLEVGRVDFYDMPTFVKSDTVLLKNYLNRNHNWRTGLLTSTTRALIDDNFTSLNLASTGYGNFSALIPYDSIFYNRDYFPSQKNGSYLWSFGCGAGSYTSCSGVGSTGNFNNDSFNNIFTILSGSFFGDWDSKNNFLRAPLAISSLASFWGGIPKWYVHHMAMGMNIGYGTRLSQNNTTFYFNGNFNAAYKSVHIALMGDPTLRQNNLNPPTQLSAASLNKNVNLKWSPSTGNKDGYNVYKIDLDNNYQKVNSQIITDTFFVDTKNYFTGTYKYAVKSVKLTTTASGTYYNVSGAAFATVSHVNGVDKIENAHLNIRVFPNPSQSVFNIVTGAEHKQISGLNISDLSGKTILYLNDENRLSDNSIQFNLDFAQSGIYILNGMVDGKQFVCKIVLIH
ncbi:MAG: T9SS type A sorting domain-containing protein [Bacteroidota bacterium]|nr:T9SS type A sorting domain-containing protein [Bacteroidota bacterium]